MAKRRDCGLSELEPTVRGQQWAALLLALVCAVAGAGLWRATANARHLMGAEPLSASMQLAALPSPANGQPVEFFLPGCPACESMADRIKAVEGKGLRFTRVDVSTPEGNALLAEYVIAYHVPPSESGSLPLVFLGDRYLSGATAVESGLSDLAARWQRGEGRTGPAPAKALGGALHLAVGGPAHPIYADGSGPAALPRFHLLDSHGRNLTNADVAGKPALLLFLCGCDRCHRFAVAWARLGIRRSGVTVWGVSGFSQLGGSLWAGIEPGFPIQYDANLALARSMCATQCPQARLIDARGRVVWVAGGPRTSPEALAKAAAQRLQAVARLRRAWR